MSNRNIALFLLFIIATTQAVTIILKPQEEIAQYKYTQIRENRSSISTTDSISYRITDTPLKKRRNEISIQRSYDSVSITSNRENNRILPKIMKQISENGIVNYAFTDNREIVIFNLDESIKQSRDILENIFNQLESEFSDSKSTNWSSLKKSLMSSYFNKELLESKIKEEIAMLRVIDGLSFDSTFQISYDYVTPIHIKDYSIRISGIFILDTANHTVTQIQSPNQEEFQKFTSNLLKEFSSSNADAIDKHLAQFNIKDSVCYQFNSEMNQLQSYSSWRICASNNASRTVYKELIRIE